MENNNPFNLNQNQAQPVPTPQPVPVASTQPQPTSTTNQYQNDQTSWINMNNAPIQLILNKQGTPQTSTNDKGEIAYLAGVVDKSVSSKGDEQKGITPRPYYTIWLSETEMKNLFTNENNRSVVEISNLGISIKGINNHNNSFGNRYYFKLGAFSIKNNNPEQAQSKYFNFTLSMKPKSGFNIKVVTTKDTITHQFTKNKQVQVVDQQGNDIVGANCKVSHFSAFGRLLDEFGVKDGIYSLPSNTFININKSIKNYNGQENISRVIDSKNSAHLLGTLTGGKYSLDNIQNRLTEVTASIVKEINENNKNNFNNPNSVQQQSQVKSVPQQAFRM